MGSTGFQRRWACTSSPFESCRSRSSRPIVFLSGCGVVLPDWLRPLAPYPRAVAALGFPAEVAGIQGRYKRCREHWANHVERTRATILAEANRAEQRRKAIILGGGLQHDLPLDELAAMFREVVLVDLIHPFASRWATRKLANV